MVDLTQLTQEQQWGLAFATKEYNNTVQVEDRLTVQEYTNKVIQDVANNHFNKLVEHKEKLFKEKFYSLTLQEQEVLMSQLGVPNVLEE